MAPMAPIEEKALFQSQIKPNVWFSETDGSFTTEVPGANDNQVSIMIRSIIFRERAGFARVKMRVNPI